MVGWKESKLDDRGVILELLKVSSRITLLVALAAGVASG